MKTSKSVVKSGCFLKIPGWRAHIFYWNEGAVSGVLRENIFVADLLEKCGKSGYFEKRLR